MTDREPTWIGLDPRVKPLARAGFVLGVGLGGFFDGIVFHQVLQVHHLLSAHPDPMIAGDLRSNVLADGLFHVATYAFTVAGIVLLLRAWRRPGVPPSRRALLGSALAGWGAFNLVEGIIDHHLLEIHHVWPNGPGGILVWDLAFLAWGAAFLVGGYALVGSADGARSPPRNGRDAGE